MSSESSYFYEPERPPIERLRTLKIFRVSVFAVDLTRVHATLISDQPFGEERPGRPEVLKLTKYKTISNALTAKAVECDQLGYVRGGTMSKNNVSEIKNAASSRNRKPGRTAFYNAELQRLPLERRRANDEIARSFLRKAGVDIESLNDAIAQNDAAFVAATEQLRTRDSRDATLRATAFQAAANRSRETAELLARIRGEPLLTSFLYLDEPIFIAQSSDRGLGSLADWSIAPFNSRMQVSLDERGLGGSPSFSFFFLWVNETGSFQVLDIATSLTVNGFCEVFAANGIFSGDVNQLLADADLSLYQPAASGIPDQVISNPFGVLSVTGNGLFGGGAAPAYQSFDYASRELVCDNLGVASQNSVLIEVTLRLSFGGPPDSDNHIVVDSADEDAGYFVLCPYVLLKLMTIKAL
jgi:hypothetical protein